MAGETQGDVRAPPNYFTVDISDVGNFFCEEVSGLDIEADPTAYRAGDSKTSSIIKMPGVVTTSNVTMKHAILANGDRAWDLSAEIQTKPNKRHTVTISLLDQEGKPTTVWKLTNAWPIKITGIDPSKGNEVAIETLEFAHEGTTVESGG